MTFEEVDLYCKGYEIRMARLKEVPRLIAAILINVNRRHGTPAMSVEKVFPLYTDRMRKVDLMSKEEFEATKKMFEKAIWKN